MTYRPGSITLTIERARPQDFGSHVCSVNKRDEFMDYSVELVSASGESDGCVGVGCASASRDRSLCFSRLVTFHPPKLEQATESVRSAQFICLTLKYSLFE